MNDIQMLGPIYDKVPLIFPSVDEENWREYPKIKKAYGGYFFDPGGKTSVKTTTRARREWSMGYLAEATKLQDLILFFAGIRGRLKSFFLPIPDYFYEPSIDSTTTASVLGDVGKTIGYIWLTLSSGAIVFRKISSRSYSALTDRTTFTWAAEVPLVIGIEPVTLFREAVLCTFKNDEIRVEYLSNNTAKTHFTFIEMLDDEFI
jgi:hypothetical protein